MKVVIQNGVQHGLSRREVESVIREFPASWRSAVSTILLCGEYASEIRTVFHKKERTLSLFWSIDAEVAPSKHDLICHLVVALAIVAERGELPNNVGATLRQQVIERVQKVLEKCYGRVASNAV